MVFDVWMVVLIVIINCFVICLVRVNDLVVLMVLGVSYVVVGNNGVLFSKKVVVVVDMVVGWYELLFGSIVDLFVIVLLGVVQLMGGDGLFGGVDLSMGVFMVYLSVYGIGMGQELGLDVVYVLVIFGNVVYVFVVNGKIYYSLNLFIDGFIVVIVIGFSGKIKFVLLLFGRVVLVFGNGCIYCLIFVVVIEIKDLFSLCYNEVYFDVVFGKGMFIGDYFLVCIMENNGLNWVVSMFFSIMELMIY